MADGPRCATRLQQYGNHRASSGRGRRAGVGSCRPSPAPSCPGLHPLRFPAPLLPFLPHRPLVRFLTFDVSTIAIARIAPSETPDFCEKPNGVLELASASIRSRASSDTSHRRSRAPHSPTPPPPRFLTFDVSTIAIARIVASTTPNICEKPNGTEARRVRQTRQTRQARQARQTHRTRRQRPRHRPTRARAASHRQARGGTQAPACHALRARMVAKPIQKGCV